MPGAQTYNQAAGQTLGPYQILREAGRGGMSMVYEAEDTRIGRRVALKVLSVALSMPPEQRDAMITRFKREARAIARLSHPNIVAIYDIGEEDGQHFIVMEFLEGLTLRDRMSEGPMPPQEAAAILDQVAAGLDAVHAAGIVHRDIKPSNVMLLPSGLVKLMDFGVARQHEDTMVTQAGTMVGSPVYMAPEQITDGSCQAASDLWSLGVILFEMLAGKPPFAGENIPHIFYQITHEKPLPLPNASPALRDVLRRALDKDPARRYGSALALAAALRAALPAPPPHPLPSALPPPPRIPRPALGHPRPAPALRPAAWAAGLLLLALLVLPLALHRRSAGPRTALSHQTARPAPIVRVAAARQERVFPSGPAAPRPIAAAVSQPDLQFDGRGLRRKYTHPRRRAAVLTAALLVKAPSKALVMTPKKRRRSHPVPSPKSVRPKVMRLKPKGVPVNPDGETVETVRKIPAILASSSTASGGGPDLRGTWRGTHSHNPATLVITHRQGNTFEGTMSVRTPEASVHIAVTGTVSPSGEVAMRETRVLHSTAPRAWDLGSETGHVAGGGRISGRGTDIKGRSGAWSFSR